MTDSQDTGHDGDFVQSLERGLSVIRALGEPSWLVEAISMALP